MHYAYGFDRLVVFVSLHTEGNYTALQLLYFLFSETYCLPCSLIYELPNGYKYIFL